MPNILIYSTHTCPYCIRAKQLLDEKGVTYKEIYIDDEPEQRQVMMDKADGRRTVPQIFINDQHIGGFDDLRALEEAGKLDPLLAK